MIKFIIFDLDNTLYSCNYGLEEKTTDRILNYIASYYKISTGEAALQRNKYRMHYGTTIEWLIAEKGFTDIEDFYRVIHPEDEADVLKTDLDLQEFLGKLPCKKAIMTNAPIEHAVRVLNKLGIERFFCEIFDMRRLNFKGKPRKDAFLEVLNTLGAPIEETLFVDDIPEYVNGYLLAGGRGILLDEKGVFGNYPGEKISNIREIQNFV